MTMSAFRPSVTSLDGDDHGSLGLPACMLGFKLIPHTGHPHAVMIHMRPNLSLVAASSLSPFCSARSAAPRWSLSWPELGGRIRLVGSLLCRWCQALSICFNAEPPLCVLVEAQFSNMALHCAASSRSRLMQQKAAQPYFRNPSVPLVADHACMQSDTAAFGEFWIFFFFSFPFSVLFCFWLAARTCAALCQALRHDRGIKITSACSKIKLACSCSNSYHFRGELTSLCPRHLVDNPRFVFLPPPLLRCRDETKPAQTGVGVGVEATANGALDPTELSVPVNLSEALDWSLASMLPARLADAEPGWQNLQIVRLPHRVRDRVVTLSMAGSRPLEPRSPGSVIRASRSDRQPPYDTQRT